MTAAIKNLDECASQVALTLDLARLCQYGLEDKPGAVYGGIDLLVERLSGLLTWLDAEAARRGEGTYATVQEPAAKVAKPKKAAVRK